MNVGRDWILLCGQDLSFSGLHANQYQDLNFHFPKCSNLSFTSVECRCDIHIQIAERKFVHFTSRERKVYVFPIKERISSLAVAFLLNTCRSKEVTYICRGTSRLNACQPHLFFTLQHVIATPAISAHLGQVNQSQPAAMDYANGSHGGWSLATGWIPGCWACAGDCHTCVPHKSIKVPIPQALGSLSGQTWYRSHLDLETPHSDTHQVISRWLVTLYTSYVILTPVNLQLSTNQLPAMDWWPNTEIKLLICLASKCMVSH